MRRLVPLLVIAALLAGCAADASDRASDGSSTPAAVGSAALPSASPIVPSGNLVDIGDGIQGPAGLVATMYATGVGNVAALDFDDAGRLWVATAAFADEGTDAIYRIDAAGSVPVKVVDGLHTVLGLVWLDDTLFVASAGRVDAYAAVDGDELAEPTTVLTLPDGVGEVNGLAMLADGRLALGVSAPCDDCTPAIPEGGAVLTFRPDGSDLQVLATGIRAPVGLAVIPASGELLVSMNQRDQLGDATPGDWLSIVEDGQDWGFPDCYGQGGAACTGVPTPLAELDRHAAVSGVAVVDGRLGTTVGMAALVAEWTTGRVVRVGLNTGETPATSTGVSTFLTGIGQPVGITTMRDGAIVVGDWGTGTIYRIAPAG